MGRPRSLGRSLAITGVVLVLAIVCIEAPRTIARFTATSLATADLGAETLDPPTGLSGTATTLVALHWTPTVDARATGYEVFRSATSGSGYGPVGIVTPTSTSTTTDSPGAGTWYYVLRSSFEAWTSLPSNEAAVTVTTLATGFQPCLSNAADTGGDGNGYESGAGRGCVTDGAVAVDASTGTNTVDGCADPGKDRHRFWGFAVGLPATVTAIDGIEVQVAVGMNSNGGTNRMCVELSWDGGTSWTAPHVATLTSRSITTYLVGGPSETWGRTWSSTELGVGTFRLRLTDVSTNVNKTFNLDGLAVQVTYRP